jgi:thiamine phosphate synthase YjbQ (UPF0047 family)
MAQAPSLVLANVSNGMEINSEGIEKLLGNVPKESKKAVVEILKKTRVVNLTWRVDRYISQFDKNFSGLAFVYDRHTTTRLAVNEYEPMLLKDVIWREAIKLAEGSSYLCHDDHSIRKEFRQDGEPERMNALAHVNVFFDRKGQLLPVQDGKLGLDRYQSLIYIDYDALPPQTRYIDITLLKGVPSKL